MKKNKTIILYLVFSVFSVFFIQATPKNDRVPIFIPNKDFIDISNYKKVIVQQYDFTIPKVEFEYKKVFENFFKIEFKKIINKNIELIKEKLINIKQDISNIPKTKSPNKKVQIIKIDLSENIKSNYQDSIIITLNMTLTIDKRHVIKEEKDKYGDIIKSFVKKIVWELKTNIHLVDVNSEKILKHYKIKKKISEKDRSSKQFNFKYLFDATMNEFIKKLTKKGHTERRYLLSHLNQTNESKTRNS